MEGVALNNSILIWIRGKAQRIDDVFFMKFIVKLIELSTSLVVIMIDWEWRYKDIIILIL